MMKLLMGPVLYAKDQVETQDVWSFFLNVFLDSKDASTPPSLRLCFTGAQNPVVFPSSKASAVADFSWLPPESAGVVWQWEVTLPRTDVSQRLDYHFEWEDSNQRCSFEPPSMPDGRRLPYEFPPQPLNIDGVVVPPRGALPNIAFFSCNGAEDSDEWKRLAKPFALWDEMLAEHRRPTAHGKRTPGFQLLIGGGDQLYADSLWDTMPDMRRCRKLADTLHEAVPDDFSRRVMAAYVDLYRERWNGTQGIAPMLARVPGVFTWDDHDIFDGWGSHESLQKTAWFKDIYSAAARAFEAFQLGRLDNAQVARLADVMPSAPERRHYFHTLAFSVPDCELDVVMLDLRSGRTTQRRDDSNKVEHVVMSEAQWKAFDGWRAVHCERKTGKARHVLVVSSIPLVHLRFSPLVERLAGGRIGLRDDLLDQWESLVHRGERTRLIMDLFSLAKRSNAAVTVLSGDVHVAARGRLRSRNPEHLTESQRATGEAIIEQVTSSGIGHGPPGPLEFLGMLMVSKDSTEDLPGFLQTELLPVGADLYLRERNWLALRVEPSQIKQPKLWARWVAEESVLPMEVVVPPPPPLSKP